MSTRGPWIPGDYAQELRKKLKDKGLTKEEIDLTITVSSA